MSVKLRRKKLADGRDSLYLDFYQNGQRRYEFLKLYIVKDKTQNKETVKLADSIRAKRELEIAHSEHGFVPAFNKRINFVDYYEKLGSTQAEGEKAWWNALNHLKAFTGGSHQFSAVSAEWLEQFKAYLLTKVSANTASTYFSRIKTALIRAKKERIIVNNPADSVTPIKKSDTERSFLGLDEIEKLAVTACKDEEVKRAFLFCCFTGLRLSDVEELRWQNMQGDSMQFRQKKTQAVEYLPLSEMARELVSGGPANVLPLPTNKVFGLRSRSWTKIVLKDWVKRAGLEKPVSFHTSRHTFATLSLTSGADLYTVSKLLGHRTLQATQIYAKVVDQRKKEAVALLPKIRVSR